MSDQPSNRFLRPETLTAIGIAVVAAGFLIPTAELRPISALLPAAMLVGLIVLAIALLIRDQRKASAQENAAPMTKAPGRVVRAFVLIVAYAVGTDLIGFYVATLITIPLVAFAFGYRSPFGLAVATAIVVGTVWLIFDFGMSQDFPVGRLWES